MSRLHARVALLDRPAAPASLKSRSVLLIEVSDYATLRDLDRRCVTTLIDLLARALPR